MTMTRTTVYLPLDAKRRLPVAAHQQHRSEADLIRDAIGRLLAEEPESPQPNPPRLDLDPSAADHADEHLSAGFDVDDVRAARSLAARYRDLKIGITDALNAVLADRYDTSKILATDQRRFLVITPLSRKFGAFRLLPADRLPQSAG